MIPVAPIVIANEKWRKRMLHERAVIDAQLSSTDRPPVTHPDGGATQPKGLFRKFNGERFWHDLRAKGHIAVDVDHCSCC